MFQADEFRRCIGLPGLSRVLLLLLCCAGSGAETIPVPLDHFSDDGDRLLLEYALAAEFDPGLPTAFVIVDAQQFYVRSDRMARIRDELLGDEFNVVGIVGRGASAEASATCRNEDGVVDWQCAYRIFRAEQWIEDIDAVRRELLGERGKVLLFGQSGGAFLVHQYLSAHGEFVQRAITPAAVNPYLETSLGINSDHFWEELGEFPDQRQMALQSLEIFATERTELMSVLQRQNFFHPANEIAKERRKLLVSLSNGDRAAFAASRDVYQVDSVNGLVASDRGISIRVRLWEFYAPSPIAEILKRPGIYPDHENTRNAALPLIEANRRGEVPVPSWDQGRSYDLDAEVLILAGRFDHTVDYRTSIALANKYRHGKLLIVRDNHTFDDMKASGSYRTLIRTFLAQGIESDDFRAVEEQLSDIRWRE